jgi:hypothetical protein
MKNQIKIKITNSRKGLNIDVKLGKGFKRKIRYIVKEVNCCRSCPKPELVICGSDQKYSTVDLRLHDGRIFEWKTAKNIINKYHSDAIMNNIAVDIETARELAKKIADHLYSELERLDSFFKERRFFTIEETL